MLASKSNTILIADDSEAIRLMLKESLGISSLKKKIVETDNGIDAVKLFKEHRPELVILDIFMPKADGLQVLGALLKIDSKAKIIITSSTDNKKLVNQAIKIGARASLLKPFDKQFALHMITTVLNQTW